MASSSSAAAPPRATPGKAFAADDADADGDERGVSALDVEIEKVASRAAEPAQVRRSGARAGREALRRGVRTRVHGSASSLGRKRARVFSGGSVCARACRLACGARRRAAAAAPPRALRAHAAGARRAAAPACRPLEHTWEPWLRSCFAPPACRPAARPAAVVRLPGARVRAATPPALTRALWRASYSAVCSFVFPPLPFADIQQAAYPRARRHRLTLRRPLRVRARTPASRARPPGRPAGTRRRARTRARFFFFGLALATKP
jgi:hypothetical protein